jgi:hypothetical protein
MYWYYGALLAITLALVCLAIELAELSWRDRRLAYTTTLAATLLALAYTM